MPHTSVIPVRFSDIDAMGHVNNAIYLNYFEQARMSFFQESIGKEWDWKKDGIVLGRNEIDYLKPILLQDSILIDIEVEKIGNKSLTIAYEVYSIKSEVRELHARGKSVIISFDYSIGKSTTVPSIWREKFSKPE